jgi:transposase
MPKATTLTAEPTPSATHVDSATLFVALELSKATWLVAVHAPDRDKLSLRRLDGGNAAGLLELIEHTRRRAEAALGRVLRVVCCYEAGYDGFWLHRLLCEHGIANHVVDPASILVDRKARRAKTDRIDVTGLLRMLMAFCRGEHQVCRMVHVPSREDEDVRHQSRERDRLVAERVAHVNRIKGILMSQGIRSFEPARRDWRERLRGLRTGDDDALRPCLMAEIERECLRLWNVIAMLARLEKEIAARLKSASDVGTERIRQLMRLRGIGVRGATALGREVFFRSFDNRRQVAHYPGLTPVPWASGAVRRDQGLARTGNARARGLAIELAWLWLRYQPSSALAAWYRARVGDAKGRLRKIMIVALARKLMVALWRYLTTGIVPAGATLT